MFNNRVEIIRSILIGSSLFLCLVFLIIILYLLYHYQQKRISLRKNENDFNLNKQSKTNYFYSNQIQKSEKQIIDQQKQNQTSPTIIQELMRKSLQLAQTAEKVADQNQKRYTIQLNIH